MFKLYGTLSSTNKTTSFAEININSEFDDFSIKMNEAYVDMVKDDTLGLQLLVEGHFNLNAPMYEVLYESVLKTAIAGSFNFISKIAEYIKNLAAKLGSFFASMTKNIERWNKEVAPRVRANLKNNERLSKTVFTGYDWNIQYLLSGLLTDMDNFSNQDISRPYLEINNDTMASASESGPINDPKSTANTIKKTIDFSRAWQNIKAKFKKESDKPEDTNKNNPDAKQKEFDVKIPENASSDKNILLEELKKMEEQYDKVVKKFFGEDIVKTITGKARSAESKEIKPTGAMVESRLDFIEKAPATIENIVKKYTDMGNGFEDIKKVLEAISNMESIDINSKSAINGTIKLCKNAVGVYNQGCKLNVNLIEACAKEYISQCNKLS